MDDNVNMEVEEDEDEDDVDFNPTRRGETLSEASSGLSSNNECHGDDVSEDCASSLKHHDDGASASTLCYNLQSGAEDEKRAMCNQLVDRYLTEKNDTVLEKPKPNQSDMPTSKANESGCLEGSNYNVAPEKEKAVAEEPSREELQQTGMSSSHPLISKRPAIEIDDEDAICKRTRARHSLANYTLEELEDFLQESDDNDDFQNVNEEEEYRKFLAAVLLEGDDNRQMGHDDEILDDDDEDDVDFAIEIEEALESDVEESFDDDKRAVDQIEENTHRPETRQKKRLRETAEKKKYFMGLEKIPLRPILPYISNGQIAPVPTLALHFPSPETFSCSFSPSGVDSSHGFTFQQLGQLYCQIHEHIQLLIQIFSVSVLEPSRQKVVMDIQELIMEMIARHEEALAWRKIPHDVSCFQPTYLRASVQIDSCESSEFSHWTPSIDNPIFSIFDVAPLRMVKSYMADVSSTVSRYRQSHLEDPLDKNHLKREPLFPIPVHTSQMGTEDSFIGESSAMSSRSTSTLSAGQLPPRKSLAATLVENTKKQTVALVPADIAKLAQRFYPLFNLSLFPHKPPIAAVANRVLFTDAEDGLLAMGLMKYNSDWESIQKHFLPCKSKHQIFVRQKNRSSSKAPDNPIKAVRRMKTSELTADEKARIHEGLKLFKQDWLSVWKFFVPHRDPSLLPRQWRIATGTQKSYRKSEAIKEKRRLYEAKRRKLKASMNDKHAAAEKESDDNEDDNSGEDMDNENEAYVHEAFLADSETGCSNSMPYEISPSGFCRSSIQFTNMVLYDGAYASGKSASNSEKPTGIMNPLSNCGDLRYTSSNNLQFNNHSLISNLGAPQSHLGSLHGPGRKFKGARVVKLAPGLPPINLPPSVRVISQSTLQNHPNGSSHSHISKNGSMKASKSPGAVKGESNVTLLGEKSNIILGDCLEARHRRDGSASDQSVTEENVSQADLHMHPLLFHASEDRFPSYYSMNRYPIASSTYLLGCQIQKDSMFSKSEHLVATTDNNSQIQISREAPGDLFSVDFHPLLQKAGDASAGLDIESSAGHSSSRLLNESHCELREHLVGNGQLPAGGASPGHQEKENNLDLNIHLYSVSETEKTRKARDASLLQYDELGSARTQSPAMQKGSDVDMSIHLYNKKSSEVAASPDTLVRSRGCCGKDVKSLRVARISDVSRVQCTNDLDESNLDIIMEHEELSDSDDESANVEFECEEIDDSEEDESEYVRPRETPSKELLPSAPVWDNDQGNCNLDHSYQPLSVRQETVDQAIKQPGLGWSCQNLLNTEASQVSSKQESPKRDTSRSLQTVLHSPRQLKKARNPKSSKVQLVGAMQDNDCKTISSKKRSACK
ncbi:uncharacterized protein LOC121995748 [Zingiber officinale]|uniref:uncharacterized protein LOC121995748 n=1 Tax=Zingiber officinale TaxID=94328 RepID=UPI001C4CAE99|nr:uncharacterized protein LOC121995748 [Zingiber officinale]